MHPHDPRHLTDPSPVPKPVDAETSTDGTSEGNLDLDDEDGINNQHLEIR